MLLNDEYLCVCCYIYIIHNVSYLYCNCFYFIMNIYLFVCSIILSICSRISIVNENTNRIREKMDIYNRNSAGGGLDICVLQGWGRPVEVEQHSTSIFSITFFVT